MTGGGALKAEFRAVRAILREDWDPIGCGVPEDEYDDYVWPVIRLLRAGAGRNAVTGYLSETASTKIGCPVTDRRSAAAADRLLALGLQGPGRPPNEKGRG